VRIIHYYLRIRVEQTFYHLVNLTVHPGKVTVEHDLLLTGILEGVYLWEVNVLSFLFLDLSHIEIGFAKILGGPELGAFLKVDATERTALRRREVTGSLSGEPAGGHVGDFGSRDEVVHLLAYGGTNFRVVDGDGLARLLGLAEDIILSPFEGFLVTGSTHEDVAAGGDDFLHAVLAVVGFQLGKFLEAEGDGDLVASCRTDEPVYLVEIKCGQLVDDDAYGQVALAVDTGDQTVEDEGVERADDLFLLRVVGDDKVAGVGLVGDFQVEVVAGEHPVGLRGNKTGGIDTERTHHTFQLVIGLVLVGTLERCHERHDL